MGTREEPLKRTESVLAQNYKRLKGEKTTKVTKEIVGLTNEIPSRLEKNSRSSNVSVEEKTNDNIAKGNSNHPLTSSFQNREYHSTMWQ